MSVEWVKIGFEVVALFLSIGGSIYWLIASRLKTMRLDALSLEKDLTGQQRNHAKSVGELKDRVAKIEAEIAHLPNKDSVHQLELAITKIGGDISTMSEKFASVARTSTRIEQYLLDKEK